MVCKQCLPTRLLSEQINLDQVTAQSSLSTFIFSIISSAVHQHHHCH